MGSFFSLWKSSLHYFWRWLRSLQVSNKFPVLPFNTKLLPLEHVVLILGKCNFSQPWLSKRQWRQGNQAAFFPNNILPSNEVLKAQLNLRGSARKGWHVKGLNLSPVNDLSFNLPHAANVDKACQWKMPCFKAVSTSYKMMEQDCKMPTVNAGWAWGRKCRNLLPEGNISANIFLCRIWVWFPMNSNITWTKKS